MKLWLKDFIYSLTGHHSSRVLWCKSYSMIQYLKAIEYKPRPREEWKVGY